MHLRKAHNLETALKIYTLTPIENNLKYFHFLKHL